MLGVVGVCEQLLGLFAGGAHADQAQRDARGLTRHGAVRVKDVLRICNTNLMPALLFGAKSVPLAVLKL